MKKIPLAVLFFVFPSLVHATILEVKCSDNKGNMVSCTVENLPNALKISYKIKKYQDQNKLIRASQIQRITGGELSKQRTAEAILLSPLFLLSKRKFETFGVEFTNDASQKDFLTLTAKKKMAHTLRTLLQSASGKEVQYSGPSDSGGVVK